MKNVSMTVIVPAFNEEGNIQKITERLISVIGEKFTFEILFVDDGSKDGTWDVISQQAKKYDFVRGIKFSRNFGKEAAIFAGLSGANGDCMVIIDSDLQHPPEKIPEMYKCWQNGYDIVDCVKSDRGEESGIHRACANAFNRAMSRLTKIDMSNAADFKLLSRRAAEKIVAMPERHMFFRALSAWIGFRTCKIEFEVGKREEGSSKWSRKSLLKYALGNIMSFSDAPLQILTFLGTIGVLLSIISLIFGIINKSAVMSVIAVQFLTSGVILWGMGIIGGYISRMYDEIKGRPRYIIEDETEDA